MKIREGVKFDFEDLLILPQRSILESRKDVKLERDFQFYHSPRMWFGIPIIASNMYATSSFAIARKMFLAKMICCLHKFHSKEKIVEFMNDLLGSYSDSSVLNSIWVSIGESEDDLAKLAYISSHTNQTPNICIDVANAGREKFINFCKRVRELFSESIIMAGNVVTPELAHELILHGGVDIVKVGLGSSSVCITRVKTGVGFPQASAIIDSSFAAHGLKSEPKRLGLICSDGGCKSVGDICKALCLGADFVMLGSFFSGCDECDGEWEFEQTPNGYVNKPIKKSLKFYGMSSKEAQEKHNGGMASHRTSEGRCVTVKAKGPIEDLLQDIRGGIVSCCTYIGATTIKDMSKCAEFIRVNRTHDRTHE